MEQLTCSSPLHRSLSLHRFLVFQLNLAKIVLPQPQIAFGNIAFFSIKCNNSIYQKTCQTWLKRSSHFELMQWRYFQTFIFGVSKTMIETWATTFPLFFQWSKFSIEIRFVLRLCQTELFIRTFPIPVYIFKDFVLGAISFRYTAFCFTR